MNIKKLQKQLDKKFPNKLTINEDEFSRIVTGSLDSWQDIMTACSLAVDVKSGKCVVNDITLKGIEIPKTKLPKITDKTLDGKEYDVVVIGGGISGASILRELSKWNIKALLIEKESDLAMHATGRNDGEVHPGVDLSLGSLKQHYVLLGNAMYGDVCKDLDVPFIRCGQYVGMFEKWSKPIIKMFVRNRLKKCGVTGTKFVTGAEIHEAEPNLNKNFKFGIYNSTAGIVCPYNMAIAYAENAVQNGGEVSLNTAVLSMNVVDGEIKTITTNRGTIIPKVVINAAGTFAEEVAKMAGDRFYSIHPRKGTNSILDKKANGLLKSIASVKLLKSTGGAHSKGGGMMRTVDHNLLIGPNAVETYEKENFETNKESISEVFNKQRNTAPDLHEREIITYFTGVRGPTFEEDFVLGRGRRTKNLIHCAGIQSPGLTTAPAIALDLEKLAVQILSETGKVEKNNNFNPVRKGVPVIREMDDETKNKYIAKNPDYGVIICRCEEISKGEIIDALNMNICVPTVDGIKKRLRPGMGRCQGGFCAPLVTKIIAEHLGVKLSEVQKSNEGSNLSYGLTKGDN